MTHRHPAVPTWLFFLRDDDRAWDWDNHARTYGLSFIGHGYAAEAARDEALAARREDLVAFFATAPAGVEGELAAIRERDIHTVAVTSPPADTSSEVAALVAHARALGLRSEDLDESILDLEHDDAAARVNAAGGPLSARFDDEHDDADLGAAEINQRSLEAQVARLVDGYGPLQARAHLNGLAASPLRALTHVLPTAAAASRLRRAA